MKYEYLKDIQFLKEIDSFRNKILEVKIIALDEYDRELDNITGSAKEGGSVSIDASSMIRRTCSLSIVADISTEEDFIKLQSLLTLKRKVILEVGYKNLLKQSFPRYKDFDIIWFPMGVYIIQSPSFQKDEQGINISLTLADKGCLLNGSNGGTFPADVTLDKEDTYIPEEEELEHFYDNNGQELYEYEYTSDAGDVKKIYSHTKDLDIEETDNYMTAQKKGATTASYAKSQLEKRKTGRMVQAAENPVPIKKIITEMVNHFGKEQLGKMFIDIPEKARVLKKWSGKTNLYLYETTVDLDGEDRIVYLGKGISSEELQDLGYAKKIIPGAEAGFIYDDLVYPGESGLTATKGQSVADILDTIANELTNYEYYYDREGNFVFQEIKNYLNTSQSMDVLKVLNESRGMNLPYGLERYREKSVYNFLDNELILSYSNNPQYELIKNDFLIWGQKNENVPIRYHVALDTRPAENAVFGDKETKFFIYPILTADVEYPDKETNFLNKNIPIESQDSLNKIFTGLQAIKDNYKNGALKETVITINKSDTNIFEHCYTSVPNVGMVFNEKKAREDVLDRVTVILDKMQVFLTEPTQSSAESFLEELQNQKSFFRDCGDTNEAPLFEELNREFGEAINKLSAKIDTFSISENNEVELNGYSFTCAKMEVYSRVAAFPESGLLGVYYYANEGQTSLENIYTWDGNKYVQFIETIEKTVDELVEKGYAISEGPVTVKNDWRTVLFFQGIMAKNEGVYANDYFEELESEWPKIYNIRRHLLSPESTLKDGDANLKNLRSEDINYFLDILETSDKINQYSVSNIGRRTEVFTNDKINCIFEDDMPEFCYINTNQPNSDNILISDFKEDIREILIKGYKPVLLSYEDYKALGTGGVLNSAFDAAKDLIYQSIGQNEKITLSIIPIYYLEPNTRIKIKDTDIGINGDYIIDSIEAPLTAGESMSLVCSRALDKL